MARTLVAALRTDGDGARLAKVDVSADLQTAWIAVLEKLQAARQSDFSFVRRADRIFRGNLNLSRPAAFALTSDEVTELTGSVMDWLGAMRTFLAHSDRKLAHTEFQTAYRAACSAAYDGAFAYRFLYRLRNSAQHLALPVHTATHGGDGWRLTLDPEALLEQYDGWSAVRSDLEALTDEPDVGHLIGEAMAALAPIAKITRAHELSILQGDTMKTYATMMEYFDSNHSAWSPATLDPGDAEPLHAGASVSVTVFHWSDMDEILNELAASVM